MQMTLMTNPEEALERLLARDPIADPKNPNRRQEAAKAHRPWYSLSYLIRISGTAFFLMSCFNSLRVKVSESFSLSFLDVGVEMFKV